MYCSNLNVHLLHSITRHLVDISRSVWTHPFISKSGTGWKECNLLQREYCLTWETAFYYHVHVFWFTSCECKEHFVGQHHAKKSESFFFLFVEVQPFCDHLLSILNLPPSFIILWVLNFYSRMSKLLHDAIVSCTFMKLNLKKMQYTFKPFLFAIYDTWTRMT